VDECKPLRRGCRYVYALLCNAVRVSSPPAGYVRVDLKTGETQRWWAGNRCFCEELIVVPKGESGWDGSGRGGIGRSGSEDAGGAGRG
jgi:carotenoid cleavage dioxygenase-like enzyme